MFKKTRRKIVAVIMLLLVLVWVGMLGIIYGFSYLEMSRQNEAMLRAHANQYELGQEFPQMEKDKEPDAEAERRKKEGGLPGLLPEMNPEKELQRITTDSPLFQLTTFYTVVFNQNGDVLEVQNEQPKLHSDTELKTLSETVLQGKKQAGTKKNLVFYQAEKGSYRLVVWMDNTVLQENAATLFRYTFLFGGAALLLFLGLSIFLARKIVLPLEENDRKQKQFISDAGHELKTPVSIVSASAELLSREIGNNPWLANIQYENERMGALIGQLLALARAEQATVSMEKLAFSRLCEGEVLAFESMAFEKGFLLKSEIAQEIWVKGSSTQLKQLLSILLDNAIRHSSGGNEIFFWLSRKGNYAEVVVQNYGNELTKEEQERIFERFYRVDVVRNGEEQHYGLGLAIAKAITMAHKGQITLVTEDSLVKVRLKLPILP